MSRKLRIKRRATRRLFVERLEQRRVLDAQLGDLADALGPSEVDETVQENAALAATAEGEQSGRFQTTEEIREFLAEDAEQRWGHLFGTSTWNSRWHSPWAYEIDVMPMMDATLAASASVSMASTADFSQTNVQVAGVDEGDIVETDGRYLYLNGDHEIVIVDTASDSGLQVVSRVDVEGQPLAIYLTDGRLSILSRAYDAYPPPDFFLSDAAFDNVRDAGPEVILTVVDIVNPAEPEQVSQIQVEGSLVDSRLIDDTLYLVSSDGFFLPGPEIDCTDSSNPIAVEPLTFIDSGPSDAAAMVIADWSPVYWDGGSCTYETREEYWARLGDDWLDMALPHFASRDGDGEVIDSGPLNSPEDIYRPLTDGADRLVSISAVDISAAAPTVVTSTAAPLNWTSELYVSQQNLYVVVQDYAPWPEGPTSSIYKFSLDDQGQGIDLAAVGEVPGTVLNQFSLDEHDGVLRIVTQQGSRASAVSGLYVLDQTQDALEIIGQIDDLAPGEQLYSVRFVGERAFVVTFGPTDGAWYDPLFTIDLSDPANPTVQGELEIPGFSNYMQLIDDDFLIGLGRNADTTNGRSLEPQVSLFDVSDFDNPQLDGRLSFGDATRSWSDAFNEHLAVSFFPESGILAIPLNTWPSFNSDRLAFWVDGGLTVPQRQEEHALYVFHIDAAAATDPIRHLGTIEHASTIKRSLRIADRLYSISANTVLVHELLDPATELDSLYYGHQAKDDRFTASQDSQDNSIGVLDNDIVDLDAESWTITVDGLTERGGTVFVSEDGTRVVYTPPVSYFGPDSFSYEISNDDGDWDEATVEIDVRISVQEDSQDNLLNILAGMGIGPDEPLVIQAAESSTWNSEIPITEDGRGLLYSPSPDRYGTDRLRYEIRDEVSGETSEHWVNVYVENVNDDPRAEDDRHILGAGKSEYVLHVLVNDRYDPDSYERLEISSVGFAASGSEVTISSDSYSLLYRPDYSTHLTNDTFTYVISDGNGGTAEATVTIEMRWADDEQRMVALARLDLAERLGGQPGDVTVVSVTEVEWPDGCLGLGGADQACTLALVPGFEVILAHDGTRYTYHTDTTDRVELAETHEVESLMQVRLEAVDLAGNPLTSVQAGESFAVNIYVKDLRDDGLGVFAAYVDLFYPSRLMEVDGEIAYGATYPNGVSGSVMSPGLVDEVGAFGPTYWLDGEERLLLSIPFVAYREGLASLVINPGDQIGSEALLYGLDEVIPWDQVELIGTEIQIEGTWQNVEQPTDINDDGITTPLDALQCIMALNGVGSRQLAGLDAGFGLPAFVDVNGDQDLSAEDALLIINELNTGESQLGQQSRKVRPLSAWVDWKSLDAEFSRDDWAPLLGVGLDHRDMLDLSHEILSKLDRDHLQAHNPADWTPRGAEQILAAVTSIQPPSAEASLDRLIEAADDLQVNIDEMDLLAILPDVELNFDWTGAKEVFRDRFFARISDAAFLSDVLD